MSGFFSNLIGPLGYSLTSETIDFDVEHQQDDQITINTTRDTSISGYIRQLIYDFRNGSLYLDSYNNDDSNRTFTFQTGTSDNKETTNVRLIAQPDFEGVTEVTLGGPAVLDTVDYSKLQDLTKVEHTKRPLPSATGTVQPGWLPDGVKRIICRSGQTRPTYPPSTFPDSVEYIEIIDCSFGNADFSDLPDSLIFARGKKTYGMNPMQLGDASGYLNSVETLRLMGALHFDELVDADNLQRADLFRNGSMRDFFQDADIRQSANWIEGIGDRPMDLSGLAVPSGLERHYVNFQPNDDNGGTTYDAWVWSDWSNASSISYFELLGSPKGDVWVTNLQSAINSIINAASNGIISGLTISLRHNARSNTRGNSKYPYTHVQHKDLINQGVNLSLERRTEPQKITNIVHNSNSNDYIDVEDPNDDYKNASLGSGGDGLCLAETGVDTVNTSYIIDSVDEAAAPSGETRVFTAADLSGYSLSANSSAWLLTI